jgi:ADP-ribose pyrophosphatase YjhB (NUDIX family)
VIEHRGSVLLCRHATKQYRYLPGGHVEFGEAAAEAAARELMEEAGLRIRVGECLFIEEQRFRQGARERHEVTIVFAGEVRGKMPLEVTSLEPGIEFVWQAIDTFTQTSILPKSQAKQLVKMWRGEAIESFVSSRAK